MTTDGTSNGQQSLPEEGVLSGIGSLGILQATAQNGVVTFTADQNGIKMTKAGQYDLTVSTSNLSLDFTTDCEVGAVAAPTFSSFGGCKGGCRTEQPIIELLDLGLESQRLASETCPLQFL